MELIPRTVIEVIDDNGHQDRQEHLELELELPAQNGQEEQDIITITDDETEVLHELQAEAELEAEQQQLSVVQEQHRERQHHQLPVVQDNHNPELEDVITISDDEEDTDRQQDIEDLVLTEHQSQPEDQVRTEEVSNRKRKISLQEDNDIITISDDEETKALNAEVRCAQATHQPTKAGGSGLKKQQRNFQKAKRPKLSNAKRPKLSNAKRPKLSNARSNCTAEVIKQYSCHICDSTFYLRAELKNHIENGQHEMVQSTVTTEKPLTSATSLIRHHNSVANMLTSPSANQNESLEDFFKRYERRWREVFLQERESNSDPATTEAANSCEKTNEEENLDDDSIWIKEQW